MILTVLSIAEEIIFTYKLFFELLGASMSLLSTVCKMLLFEDEDTMTDVCVSNKGTTWEACEFCVNGMYEGVVSNAEGFSLPEETTVSELIVGGGPTTPEDTLITGNAESFKRFCT